MSQQLNLLPQAKSRYSPAVVALMLLGLAALGLFATWGIKQNTLRGAQTSEQASAAQLKQVSAQLEERFRARAARLNDEIKALKPRAEEAEQLIRLAAGIGRPEGYSPYFSSLVALREDGLWLSDVTVGQAGKSMQLGGHALDKDAVLRFTQRANVAFAGLGVKLTTLEMTPQPLAAGATDTTIAAGKGAPPLTPIKFSLR